MRHGKTDFFDTATVSKSGTTQAPSQDTSTGNRVLAIERRLLRRLLQDIGNPPVQVVLWDGEELSPAIEKPVARVIIRERSTLYRLLRDAELYFGEDYRTGRIEVEGDLVSFLETAYKAISTSSSESRSLTTYLSSCLSRPRRNTLSRSKQNIHHHYDIGNEFYKLWLDEQMVYTCAYFPDPAATLEEAQIAKMDHVCRKLRLEPGETVVEAGCGWGSLARHMARHYGVKVKAFNISHEQVAYARERAKTEGLDDLVEYYEDDYRNITGKFDAFVSVGMLEHVGTDNYPELGAVINRCLSDTGRGLIHSIGRNKSQLMSNWIERRIFPGAHPPTLREMMDIFEPWSFSVLDVENIRLHYAKTLEHWLERFEQHVDRVTEMFDEVFVRTWRLYLAGSIAAFTSGDLQLFQIVFARPTNNNVPWTRAHLYKD